MLVSKPHAILPLHQTKASRGLFGQGGQPWNVPFRPNDSNDAVTLILSAIGALGGAEDAIEATCLQHDLNAVRRNTPMNLPEPHGQLCCDSSRSDPRWT